MLAPFSWSCLPPRRRPRAPPQTPRPRPTLCQGRSPHPKQNNTHNNRDRTAVKRG